MSIVIVSVVFAVLGGLTAFFWGTFGATVMMILMGFGLGLTIGFGIGVVVVFLRPQWLERMGFTEESWGDER
jgi:ABC-type nitrate/sulfonate/bicarbonate transport system permease component